ncbi:MAG: rod shape-determining protein MreD [Candidatus Omnitrophota bacterium]
MRKPLFLTFALVVFFAAEFLLFNLFGSWFRPNLLLLLVIFANSIYGIRYSLFVAFAAGLLKDSFSAGIFGVHIFAFVLCAYATTLIKRYFYELEIGLSQILTTFLISLLNGLTVYCILLINENINFIQAVQYVILPNVILTTLVSVFIYKGLRQCASKLFA